jgi:hypothetical protein
VALSFGDIQPGEEPTKRSRESTFTLDNTGQDDTLQSLTNE